MKPRSVMMYGSSGSTKTSQCYHLVKWILGKEENQGKHFRMIHSDGGGYAPFQDSGMIEDGRVRVFDMSNRKHALSDYRKLSGGYWPKIMLNTKTQERVEYFQKDEKCETKDWGKVAGYIIEGLASTGEALKTHISNQNEGVGFKESWKYEEDGETLIGLQQGHYGMIQKEVYERHMKGFNTLPVQWLIVTSLLGKGTDRKQGIDVYGPQLVGDASTPNVPGWFMDCLHLDIASWKEGEKEYNNKAVAWFTRHQDSMGNPFLCKARCLPELYPELIKRFPMGFVPLGFKQGIEKYFIALEELRNVT